MSVGQSRLGARGPTVPGTGPPTAAPSGVPRKLGTPAGPYGGYWYLLYPWDPRCTSGGGSRVGIWMTADGKERF